MRTFAINTLGCKVNQYESQQIRHFLQCLELDFVPSPAEADLVIVHTCCVTHTASSKSRQYIRKARKSNPAAKIIVSGCLANPEINETKNLDNDIYFAENLDKLSTLLPEIINSAKNHAADSKIELPNLLLDSFTGQTRAFLKIQDGCDGNCSYCIIRTTRPNITNKSEKEIITESRQLVNAGHKEIVLTGVCLGAYGQKTTHRNQWDPTKTESMPNLLGKIAQIPGLARLRLSSLAPLDVTDSLLKAYREYPNIAHHLHLSLQSGSDNILKKMNRPYMIDDFHNIIEKIMLQLDNPAITTDIIVGFPGESDEDFEQTVAVAQQTGFAKMHVFSFSPRPGTVAAKMQPKVSSKIIKERSQILHKLDKELAQKFQNKFVGQKVEVIVENEKERSGRCERYYTVKLIGEQKLQKGDLVCGKIRNDTQTANIIE